MERATLILNPRAGSARKFTTLASSLIEELARHGIAGEAMETKGPATAGRLSAAAVASGADAVFACGGDGTVHETLQGVAGTHAALGVIPVGTANALARNLGLPLDPVAALRLQIAGTTTRIAVGEVNFGLRTAVASGDEGAMLARGRERRYFAVMAGAGPDGALVYSLLDGRKSALGRNSYYVHAAKLFLTQRFPRFRIAYRLPGAESWQEDFAVSAMSARIGDLGGVFGRLTPGSSLQSNTLRLSYLRPPGRISLPSWFISGQLGIHGPRLDLRPSDSRCTVASDPEAAIAQLRPLTLRLPANCSAGPPRSAVS